MSAALCQQSESDLLAAWNTLAGERLALQGNIAAHGVNSQARARFLRLDHVLGSKLLDVGDALRARGVDPNGGRNRA